MYNVCVCLIMKLGWFLLLGWQKPILIGCLMAPVFASDIANSHALSLSLSVYANIYGFITEQLKLFVRQTFIFCDSLLI